LKTDLLGTNLGMAQANLTADEMAIAAAQQSRAEGIGEFAGGVGSAADAYATGGTGKFAKGMQVLNGIPQ
jgi:hypothetical protein